MHGLASEENLDGIRIVRIPSFRTEAFRATFFVMLAFVLGGLWSGLRVIRQFQPDIIHTHFAVPSGALAWALSLMSGIPYVLTAHLGDVPGGVPEKTGAWFRWLMPFTHTIWQRAKRVVAVSEFTRQLALRHYNVDIEVIPNGADVQLLSPSEIRINQPPRLVFAGRFVTQKNIQAIIQTLAQLKHLDWRCAMLGDGPLFEEARTEIKRNDMEERFELPGWLTPGEVLDWFTKSDILFMPSQSEGLPVVGVQALAKGLALVVSNIGGFVDLVDDRKNGYLIDLHDQHRFVHVLQDLLSDPMLLSEFRKQSLEKAGHFELNSISKKYEDIFLNVLSHLKK
jgi:glycosyltransferase involved in cell wall biosynthesis